MPVVHLVEDILSACSGVCAKICGGDSCPPSKLPISSRRPPCKERITIPSNAAFIIENHGKDPHTKYDFEKTILGEGSYGTVCRGVDKKSKAIRAIKTIAKQEIPDKDRFQEEIHLMKAMDHPNIIKLYETFECESDVYLVMEMCEGGTMQDLLIEHGLFCERDVATLMRQVLRAVFYMHNNGVVHRDIKPANILCDSKGPISKTTLKVIDFGISCGWCKGDAPLSNKYGTHYFMAPELLAGEYGSEVDIWSCAVTMYILFCGNVPFCGQDDGETTVRAMKRGKVDFEGPEWAYVSLTAQDLMWAMLRVDPEKRITAEQALGHKFFQQFINNDEKLQLSMVSSPVSNIKAFRGVDRLKKAALRIIAHHLSTPQLEKLKDVFIKLDVDQDGQLTLQEITNGIQSLDLNLARDFAEVFSVIDTACNGIIDYTEFLAASMSRKLYSQESACWDAFYIFDRDGNGSISSDDLKQVLAHVPDDATMEENSIEDLMERYDVNNDGVIDFQEFMAIMQTCP